MGRIFTGLVVVSALVVGLLGWGVWRGSERALYPDSYDWPRDFDENPRNTHHLDFEEVEFPTTGGRILRGWMVHGVPRAFYGVVVVHGGSGDRRAFLSALPALHATGYPVLLFDLSGHGKSDGASRGIGFGFREQHDVSAAVHYMKRRLKPKRVAVIGWSMGANATLLAAAGDPEIDVIVAMAPYTSLMELMRDGAREQFPVPGPLLRLVRNLTALRAGGWKSLEAIDVVDRIGGRPLLLVHGQEDRIVPPQHSERLFEKAAEPKQLWIVEGAGHDIHTDAPEAWEDRVVGFIRDWLGPAQRPARTQAR